MLGPARFRPPQPSLRERPARRPRHNPAAMARGARMQYRNARPCSSSPAGPCIHLRSVAPSRSRLIGFSSTAVKPTSPHPLRINGPFSPVTAIIGIVEARPHRPRIRRVASNPSSPGIWISIRMASKLSRLARHRLVAVTGNERRNPHRVRAASRSDWFTLSSSTTRTRPPRAADAVGSRTSNRRSECKQLLSERGHLVRIRRQWNNRIHFRGRPALTQPDHDRKVARTRYPAGEARIPRLPSRSAWLAR